MKPILATLPIAALLAFAAPSAFAQTTDGDDSDSYSYHHTEVLTGPDVAKAKAAGATVMTHEIPTIDDAPEGHARADVNFLTGGIGDDERASIESAKAEYNVHITNARVDGAFVGDTQITIREEGGQKDEMLTVDAGPLLYVQLPPGKYVMTASHNDEQKQQNFTISEKRKMANVTLRWKTPTPVAN